MSHATAKFENIAAHNTVAPISSYLGFTWDNFTAIDRAAVDFSDNGYIADVHSGRAVASACEDGVSEIDPHGTFTLVSGYFAAAWSNNLKVTFFAFHGGVLTGEKHVTLDPEQTFITFGPKFRHIDDLKISSFGGADANPGDGSGNAVAMDDLLFKNIVHDGFHPADVAAALTHTHDHHIASDWHHVPLM